jgi:hypothetical protein
MTTSEGFAERLRRLDPAATLSTLRLAVGVSSWLSPSLTWRAVGWGDLRGDPRAGALTRLFGVRELSLALATAHPDVERRRAALRIGVAIDSVDTVAGLISVRKGAPVASLLGVAAGAAAFAGLGAVALRTQEDHVSGS